MTHLLAVVLAATKFDDSDFIAAAVADDFCRHASTPDIGSADFNALSLANHQYLVESQAVAGGEVEFFDFECFAFDNAVLLAAAFNYCVHGFSPYCGQTRRLLAVLPLAAAFIVVTGGATVLAGNQAGGTVTQAFL